MGGERAEAPADRHADQDQLADPPADPAQLLEVQAEPAFEQDDGDGHGDHRLKEFAEIVDRRDDPEYRPGEEPGHRHQHNRRQVEAPCQPLRADAEHADQRDLQDKTFVHPRHPSAMPQPSGARHHARRRYSLPYIKLKRAGLAYPSHPA